MPYIEIKTNVTVTDEKVKSLNEMLGREIELLPGKTEKWLMNCIAGDCKMAFAGDFAPCAIAVVSLFGKASSEAYDNLTASLCEKLGASLGIDESRVYVKYEEVSTWGWNRENF